ncbi:GIY-YIG catalytic domain-containing endonuclease [Paramecium bursaria Chlorella virus NW665.2]|nr:GIY-YIG catalytic domain-containing endonuclease [Paramecium bursaria Chlorella virus NW665.2]
MGFIYMLTSPSRKSYIGQTICPIHERLAAHQKPSSNCRAIYNAIKKYGWENFEKDWYEVPDEDLNKHEELMVEVLGTLSPDGYNLKEGGGAHGRPSKETKQKMREAKQGEKCYMYGKNHMEETKQKIREAQTGTTRTEEAKQKMSEAHTGKALNDEHKKKISKATLGENNHNSKKVYQYDLDGTYVNAFASSGEVARSLNKTDGTLISMCARGKRPSAYGFKWTREKL